MSEDSKILKKIEAENHKLKRLKAEIESLINDATKRFKLPVNKTYKERLKLLRKFDGLKRHQFDIYFSGFATANKNSLKELYEFNKELIDKWTIGDVEKYIKLCKHAFKLSNEKAISKIIVDDAICFNFLYDKMIKK